jgi:hypothetical protein
MYVIREMLAVLIFAVVAFSAVFIPYMILCGLYAACQSWLTRNSYLLTPMRIAIRSSLVVLIVVTRRAGESIRAAGLTPWPR